MKHRTNQKVWFIVSAFHPPAKIRGTFPTYQKAKQLADILAREEGYEFHILRVEPCK